MPIFENAINLLQIEKRIFISPHACIAWYNKKILEELKIKLMPPHILQENIKLADDKIYLDNFNKEIDKILQNKYPRAKHIEVNAAPSPIWLNVGLNNVKIVMPVAVFYKATKEKHKVDERIIRNLPVLLQNPRYIFKSTSDSCSFVGVLDEFEQDKTEKKPLIAVIRPVYKKVAVNIILSIYGKDKDFISREISKGNLLYQRK